MARLLRERVESGKYVTHSEVMCEALTAWQVQEAEQERCLAVIRRKIAEADADPAPSLTEEDMDRHFAALYAEHE